MKIVEIFTDMEKGDATELELRAQFGKINSEWYRLTEDLPGIHKELMKLVNRMHQKNSDRYHAIVKVQTEYKNGVHDLKKSIKSNAEQYDSMKNRMHEIEQERQRLIEKMESMNRIKDSEFDNDTF